MSYLHRKYIQQKTAKQSLRKSQDRRGIGYFSEHLNNKQVQFSKGPQADVHLPNCLVFKWSA
jgi:hypothetical protein